MASWVYVGVGGALGALLRHFVQTSLAAAFPGFPAGTALVNLAGCLVIGMLVPLLPGLPDATRPFVVVGVLGGLTTMSSFSLEVVGLLGEGRPLAAVLHWTLGALGCVALCALGYFVGSRLAGAQLR